MGIRHGRALYVVFGFGTQLIASAPHSIVTVFDFTNCYAAPPVALPCERVASSGRPERGAQRVCGLLLMAVAAWLVWDLWSAAAPRPITDDFLKLLEDSFARDWRKPRTGHGHEWRGPTASRSLASHREWACRC